MRVAVVLALVALLGSVVGHAGELSLSFGPSLDGDLGTKKMVTTAYEWQWNGPAVAIEAGGVSEGGGNGANFYAGVNPGIHVMTSDGLVARVGFGVVCFSRTDDRLSSLPEFHIQAGFGYSSNGYEAGVRLDHFSNGGIWPNNPGLDVASIYIGIPVW